MPSHARPNPLEEAILADLRTPGGPSYEQIADRHGVSRGKVWAVACKFEARKHEARIRERAVERRRRQREFLLEVLNATHKADVLDFLDGLPDGSLALHLTSIPFNVGKRYGEGPSADRLLFHHFVGWVLQVLSEMNRTLQPGGRLVLQLGTTRDDQDRRRPLDVLLFDYLLAMGLSYEDRIIWEKPHGLTPEGRLADRYETALVFSKGPSETFNANAARIPQKEPDKRAFRGPNIGQLSGHPLGAWPTNIWRITPVSHGQPEKTGHPAQFPEELARRAILLYTMPGDLVCDPFVGSGTTAAACIQTGRAFTGCDLFYEDLRSARLAQVAPDLACDFPGVTADSLAVWQAEARIVNQPVQQQLPVLAEPALQAACADEGRLR